MRQSEQITLPESYMVQRCSEVSNEGFATIYNSSIFEKFASKESKNILKNSQTIHNKMEEVNFKNGSWQ